MPGRKRGEDDVHHRVGQHGLLLPSHHPHRHPGLGHGRRPGLSPPQAPQNQPDALHAAAALPLRRTHAPRVRLRRRPRRAHRMPHVSLRDRRRAVLPAAHLRHFEVRSGLQEKNRRVLPGGENAPRGFGFLDLERPTADGRGWGDGRGRGGCGVVARVVLKCWSY